MAAPLAALAGSALYEAPYAALGSVLGQPQMLHAALVRIVVVVSAINAVLAIPALRLVRGARRASIEGMPISDAGVGAARERAPVSGPARTAGPAGLGILEPREPVAPPALRSPADRRPSEGPERPARRSRSRGS